MGRGGKGERNRREGEGREAIAFQEPS